MTYSNIKGKLLIATTKIQNRIFKDTVVFIHTCDETECSGVISNLQMDYDQAMFWSKDVNWHDPTKLFHGGPKEQRMGYLLHDNSYSVTSSIQLNDTVTYTTDVAVLEDIKNNVGPKQFALFAGYCIWDPNVLLSEIEAGKWIVMDFDSDIFFSEMNKLEKWSLAMKKAATNHTAILLAKK